MKKTHNLLAVMMLLLNIVLQPILSIQEVFAEEATSETVMDSTVITSVVEEVSEIPEEIQDTEPIIPEESSEVIDSPTSEGEEEPVSEGEFVSSEDTEETAETSDSEEIEETEETEESEDETDKEAITTISLNNSNNTTTNLRTGSTSRFSFNVSNTGDVLENAVIRVTVPLTYLATHGSLGQYFPNQGLDSLLSSRVEGNNLIVDYNVQTLSESYNTNFTFEFKSIDDGSVTNGAQIPVKASVVKSGSEVAQTSNVNYQFVTRQPNFSTNVTYPAEASDLDDEEGQRLTEILYSFSFDNQGVGNGSGRSKINSVKVKTIVPETLSFNENLNESWQYDEASRTATYSFTPDASIYDAAYSMPNTLTLITTNNKEVIQESIFAEATFEFASGEVVTKSNQAEVAMMALATQDVNVAKAITANYITGATLVLNPLGTTPVTVTNGQVFEIVPENNDIVQLTYDFAIPDSAEVHAGDTYSVLIPEIIQSGNVKDQPFYDENDVELGTFSISGQTLTVTFGEAVEKIDEKIFDIYLTGRFNKDMFNENNEVPLKIPLLDETSFEVVFKPIAQPYEGTDQKKAGKPYVISEGNKVEVERNPEFVDWTVRVNDSMESYENASIIDIPSSNLEFVADNFKVERIIRNYKNDEIGRETVTGLTPTPSANGFELNIGSIKDAYDLVLINPQNHWEVAM